MTVRMCGYCGEDIEPYRAIAQNIHCAACADLLAQPRCRDCGDSLDDQEIHESADRCPQCWAAHKQERAEWAAEMRAGAERDRRRERDMEGNKNV
jgi:hypothetical protein